MEKTKKQKFLEAFFIMLPGLIYVLIFIFLWVSVSARTSRPGYTEDYSGLGLIAVPFLAFVHYTGATLVAGIVYGLTRLFGAKINFLPVLAGTLVAPIVVVLFMWAFGNLFGY